MRTLRLAILALLPLVSMFPTAIHSGQTACPSSGNTVVARGLLNMNSYTLIADSANTGVISIGGSTVTTSNGGIQMNALTSYTTPSIGNAQGYNLSNVYFACTVSADKLDYVYQQ